jgi:hypothetical protein
MTIQDLKIYLQSLSTAGLKTAQLDQLVTTAIEAGYAAVWGAYRWKIKRRQKSTTTTSGQAYTGLPSDFESIRGVTIQATNTPTMVDIQEEESFDRNFPYPAFHTNSQPTTCKVVRNESGGAGDKWRLYWFPIPNQAYNITIVYDATADSANFPSLPSYMQQAVIEKCCVLIQGAGDARLAFLQSANAALQAAIYSDRTSNEYTMQWGGDPGWDDWWNSQGGGSAMWYPYTR